MTAKINTDQCYFYVWKVSLESKLRVDYWRQKFLTLFITLTKTNWETSDSKVPFGIYWEPDTCNNIIQQSKLNVVQKKTNEKENYLQEENDRAKKCSKNTKANNFNAKYSSGSKLKKVTHCHDHGK